MILKMIPPTELINDLHIKEPENMCQQCLLNLNFNTSYDSESCEEQCIYEGDNEEYINDLLQELFLIGGFPLYNKYSTLN